jgi:hypothetical protein
MFSELVLWCANVVSLCPIEGRTELCQLKFEHCWVECPIRYIKQEGYTERIKH